MKFILIGGSFKCVLGALLLVTCTASLSQPRYEDGPLPYPVPGYRHGDPRQCDMYARDQSYRYAPRGAGALGSAGRGAVGGAVFGAIVGGSRGARRGAMAGAGIGVIANGARVSREREYAYQLAYDDCMRGFPR